MEKNPYDSATRADTDLTGNDLTLELLAIMVKRAGGKATFTADDDLPPFVLKCTLYEDRSVQLEFHQEAFGNA